MEDTKSSAALVQAASRAIAAAHPDRDDHEARARYLADKGSIGLTGDGGIYVVPAALETIRQVAPGLLGERPDTARPATKIDKAKANEKVLAARLEASRKLATPILRDLAIKARLAALETEIPGDSFRARAARARASEEIIKEAYATAGRNLGALNSNGVE